MIIKLKDYIKDLNKLLKQKGNQDIIKGDLKFIEDLPNFPNDDFIESLYRLSNIKCPTRFTKNS